MAKITMPNLSRSLARLGAFIIVAGLGLDLLPGTRPGFNSLQIIVILSGICALLLDVGASRPGWRIALRNQRSALAKAALISGFTLVVLELALGGIGYETYFPQDIPEEFLRPAPWRACEDPACHYLASEMADACELGQMSGRYCILNAQGFHDTQDFVYSDDLDERLRILMLGDSFTFGEDADIGRSYVETIEAALPGAVVWNTGIFGVGTNQSYAAFQMFAPELRPQLTIYGFYINDFFDNLFPVDGYYVGIKSDGEVVTLQQYHLDPWGNVTKLEAQSLLYYRWRGVEAPANEFERLLGSTRVGSLFVSAVDYVGKQLGIAQRAQLSRQVELTREYLIGLRDASAARDSALLILLIPKKTDIAALGTEYQMAVDLFDELGIAYLSPAEALDAAADYAPDRHWNNAGHQKVGGLLADCIQQFMRSGEFKECAHVTLP